MERPFAGGFGAGVVGCGTGEMLGGGPTIGRGVGGAPRIALPAGLEGVAIPGAGPTIERGPPVVEMPES